MSASMCAATAFERVQDALHANGCRPRSIPSGLQARCPAHEDGTPSLTVGSRDDGRGVVVHCHAGCTAQAVVDAVGLRLSDLYDELRVVESTAVQAEVRYRYVDEQGQLLFEVVRKPGKQFRQRVPDGNGGWIWKLGDTRRVLYRLPEVLAAVAAGQQVYVVEGEKDADRLHRHGVVATCNPGGAGKWRAEYAQHLAGADVVIVADRDETGRKHVQDVRASLTSTARAVTLLEPAQGKDVSDHLDARLTLDQMVPAGAPSPAEPPTEQQRYTPVDWHELFSRDRTVETAWLCEPFVEAGRVTALYSKPKAGKSLLTLDIVAALAAGRSVLGGAAAAPISVLYIDLENTEDDIWERLRDMGYGPDDLTGHLHYYSFPDLPALDSERGGAHLLQLAQRHEAKLVVIDTTSRVITGQEDSADTFRALYRHALMPLKREGRAVLRLDHTGKDPSAGQRGSSAKNDAEDYVWFLTSSPADRIDLRRTHSRTTHGADQLSLRRLTEPWLRHVQATTGVAEHVQRVLNILEELEVPVEWGRDKAKAALGEAGHKIGNDLLAATLRVRRESTLARADLSANLAADLERPSLLDQPDDLSAHPIEVPGQACPGQVQDSPDRPPAGASR